jgi:hypothetical protein
VQLFDIFPTFLELANASSLLCSTSNVTGYVQFGTSLVPWLRGQAPSTPPHEYVFAEGGYYYQNEIEYNDPTQASTWDDPHQIYYPRGQEEHLAPSHAVRFVVMRNSTFKMVYRHPEQGVQELYDLVQDPLEATNVWGQPAYASAQNTMLGDMLEWFLLTGDVTPRVYDSRAVPPGPAWPWPPHTGTTDSDELERDDTQPRMLRTKQA